MGVTISDVSCNSSIFQWSHEERLHWLVPQAVATQVVGQMLHYKMLEKIVATLCEELRKVELNFDFRDGFCNVAR